MRKRIKAFLFKELGFVLPTVVVFVFVMTLSAVAFFSMASYESKNAIYRQNSTEAFYLADAAISRAMAQFQEDSYWRDGWSCIPAGNGVYSLSVSDTTYMGQSNIIRLLSLAQVKNARRSIEVMIEVGPSAFSYALFVVGWLSADGNICIDGKASIGGRADFGPNDVHLQCGGTYVDRARIPPPKVFTEPDYYPNATYYYVYGTEIGGTFQARIYDRNGNDITTALGDSLVGVTSYDSGADIFTFDFNGSSTINDYFDDSSGLFSRDTGDQAVVVNFGDPSLYSGTSLSNVIFKGTSSAPEVHATILNSRFTGATDEQRKDTTYWTGGFTEGKKVVFEPYYGLSMICHDFLQGTGGLLQVGTEDYPALTFVTGNASNFGANFVSIGEIIVLGYWSSQGGPELYYDPDFQDNLPWYFFDVDINGITGQMKPLRWREVACAD